MDTQLTNTEVHSITWEIDEHDKDDCANGKLSFDPSGAAPLDMGGKYCSVNTAANALGKSPRQIQRLLKAGQLRGEKINGPNGAQWLVDNEFLSERINAGTTVNLELLEKIKVLEATVESLNAELNSLRQKTALLEDEHLRLASTVTTPIDSPCRWDNAPPLNAVPAASVQKEKTPWWRKAFEF